MTHPPSPAPIPPALPPAATVDAHHLRLAASATVTPAGHFLILAITAGDGNGWRFSPAVLRASLPLWDGVETFVDHGALHAPRSVRDLGGLCHSPQWDAARQGITLQLRTAGPSGPLVHALGRELLAAGQPSALNVGFSADLLFTPGPDQTVHTILRVLSLDLVFHPARGGAFLRALNRVAKGDNMPPTPQPSPAEPLSAVPHERPRTHTEPPLPNPAEHSPVPTPTPAPAEVLSSYF